MKQYDVKSMKKCWDIDAITIEQEIQTIELYSMKSRWLNKNTNKLLNTNTNKWY